MARVSEVSGDGKLYSGEKSRKSPSPNEPTSRPTKKLERGGGMRLNFYPFHKHNYELIRWRLVHHPHWEPSRIVTRLKCQSCGKEKNRFTIKERDEIFESENRHLEGFWFGNEKEVSP